MNQEKCKHYIVQGKNPNTLYLLTHWIIFTLVFTTIFIIILFGMAHAFIGYTGKQIASTLEISRIYSIKNQSPNIPLGNIFSFPGLLNDGSKYYIYKDNETLVKPKQPGSQSQAEQQHVQKILDRSFYGLNQQIQTILNNNHVLIQNNGSFHDSLTKD